MSDISINVLAKNGMNFQFFDFEYYKQGIKIMLCFSSKEDEKPAVDPVTLQSIALIVKCFIETNRYCEEIKYIRFDTQENERRIYFNLYWESPCLKINEFTPKLLNYVKSLTASSIFMDKDNISLVMDDHLITFEKDTFERAKNTLIEFLEECIKRDLVYNLDPINL